LTAAFDWTPAAILPNLSARNAVEGDVIALAPGLDPRVQAFCTAHPKFGELLSRFTDAFHIPLDPVVLIVRDDVLPKLAEVDPLASFRDLVALCVIPYCRSLAAVYPNPHRVSYSSSFSFYPWMRGAPALPALTPRGLRYWCQAWRHKRPNFRRALILLCTILGVWPPCGCPLLRYWLTPGLRIRVSRASIRSLSASHIRIVTPGDGATLLIWDGASALGRAVLSHAGFMASSTRRAISFSTGVLYAHHCLARINPKLGCFGSLRRSIALRSLASWTFPSSRGFPMRTIRRKRVHT
jgi:hypothetical protein